MKQTFYLDLTHDGVRLRQEQDREVRMLGEVALDDPQFAGRLEALRRTGEEAAEGGLGTVLIVPQSEVLFTTVTADAADPTMRQAQVRTELDGMTPYRVEDLAFDWRPVSGTEVAVAVVARETLDQAEDFAVAHGFAPRAFASEATPPLFPDRPVFGPTAFARASAEATQIPGTAASGSDPGHPVEPPPLATGFHETPAPPPLKIVADKDAPPPQASGRPSADATPASAPRPADPDATATDGPRVAAIASRIAILTNSIAGPRPDPQNTAPVAAVPARPDHGPASPTPTVHRIDPDEGLTGEDSPGAGPTPGGTPAAGAEAFDPSVSGKENPSILAPPRRNRRDAGMSILPIAGGLAVAVLLAAAIWTAFYVFAARDDIPGLARETESIPPFVDAGAEPPAPDDAMTADGPVAEDLAGADPETSRQDSAGDDAATLSAEPPAAIAPASPDTAGTGAPDPLDRPAGAGEAGRYAATGIDTTPPVPPEPPSADRPGDRVAPQDRTLRPQDRIVALTDPDTAGGRPSDLQTPPLPRNVPDTGTPPETSGSATPARDAAPASAPPPGDPASAVEDPAAELTGDPVSVTPTPEGALTPEGVRVTAGAPPVRPPAAPERPGSDAAPADGTVVPVTDGPPPVTPPARPESAAAIAPPPSQGAPDVATGDADPTEAAAPAPPPDPVDSQTAREIARISPRPRPATETDPPEAVIDPADTDAAVAAAIPDDVPAAVLSPTDAAPDDTATAADPAPMAGSPSAVARSLPPRGRPADLARRVEAARIAPAGRAAAATLVPTVTPPDPGRVDLIGVYGSVANRRALVRLPNGRFVKVEVGDGMDGGRVSDISASTLSYEKAGQAITLNMPSG